MILYHYGKVVNHTRDPTKQSTGAVQKCRVNNGHICSEAAQAGSLFSDEIQMLPEEQESSWMGQKSLKGHLWNCCGCHEGYFSPFTLRSIKLPFVVFLSLKLLFAPKIIWFLWILIVQSLSVHLLLESNKIGFHLDAPNNFLPISHTVYSSGTRGHDTLKAFHTLSSIKGIRCVLDWCKKIQNVARGSQTLLRLLGIPKPEFILNRRGEIIPAVKCLGWLPSFDHGKGVFETHAR